MVIAVVALVSLAAVAFASVALNSTRLLGADPDKVNVSGGAVALGAWSSRTAERAPSVDRRPGTAPSHGAAPVEGPFGQIGGWIAYNDGTGIWAVNPRKTYPGVFSPSDNPAPDAVRLAGPAAGDPIAWSADGSRLLVRRRSASMGYRGALFVLHAEGTETRVTDSRGDREASISPDGTLVVYATAGHPSRLELATVGEAPPEVRGRGRAGRAGWLLSSEEGHLDAPAFSPDSRRIAYIDGGGDHSNALWVIDADGTNRRKLAGGDWSHVDHLVWSPDGERLAFSCRCPAGTGVYTIRADGSRLTLVSPDEVESMPKPQWSPDGSQIALVHEDLGSYTVGKPTTGTLVVVGAEGGEERQLIRFHLFRVDDLGNLSPVTIAWNPAASVEPSGASTSPSGSFPTAAFADVREGPVAEEAADEFQAILNDMAGGGGIAATVMSADGTWSGAAGKADGVRDVRVNDQFAIGSVTKSVIAAQVMQMVEAGELDLDDPATDHLPPDLDFDTNGATIRQLLGHRSGIPDYYPRLLESLSTDRQRAWLNPALRA